MPNPLTLPIASLFAGGSALAQGEQQRKAQVRASRDQDKAQHLAQSRAAAELRRQDQEHRRLNKRKPDVANLLGNERNAALTGPGSTVLTGTGTRERSTLGRSSLLGTV